jgi:serine/threonine-protein kinase
MSLVGRVFSNRYEIEREVAQGGMAEVYLARDRLLDRPVALKALFPEYAREPSFVERFRREAQAAANLNHQNIVAIYDWGQEGGTYFIVMEYVEGRSLRDLIRSEGPLDPHQTADVAAEIASALGFAHRAGVVHRDVKPGNVLLTRAGAVKVTDFGIARAGASDGLTQTGSVMGTATYFSPEQAQGLPVDGRSDVYSLGVVLYEMVTGVVPFTGDSPVAVAYKHVREEVVPPTRRNPDVPADLEQIILTALAKDPDLRYQTAEDLRADLLRFRRGRPLAAAPVTAIVSELPTSATAAAGAAAYQSAATMQAPRVGGGPPPGRGPYGPPPGPPPGRGRALAAGLTVLVLVLVVVAILLLSQLGSDGGGATVSVPNVVGMTEDDAREALGARDLEVEAEYVRNIDVPDGEVFEQDPAAGARVDEGSTVTITVSGEGETKEVPDVEGELAEDARTTLEAAGFTVEFAGEQHDEVEFGLVIRTEPAAGERATTGSTITVIVSQGPEPVDVPNVVNLPEAEANRILSDRGFGVRIITEPSDDVDAGRVIRTVPSANDRAPAGSTVEMYVSSGTEQVTVPEVRGQDLASAKAEIEAAGLSWSVVEAPSTAGNDGRVIAQDPAPSTRTAPGTTVVLTVGVFSPPPTTTTTPAPTTTAAP